jgi:hypothetical protein
VVDWLVGWLVGWFVRYLVERLDYFNSYPSITERNVIDRNFNS